MMKKLTFLMLLCTLSLKTEVKLKPMLLPYKSQIQKLFDVGISLLLQYETLQLQQNNQVEPTEQEYKDAENHAWKTYQKQIDSLSFKEIKELVALLKNFKNIVDLTKILNLLFGKESAEIIIALLQQIAQQKRNDLSVFATALAAVKEKKTFATVIQERFLLDLEAVKTATPEETEQAQAMLEQSNHYYIALFNAIIIDFLQEKK
jgi:hypothetical protein